MTRLAPFPPSIPFASGRLRVSELHELYYERHGNPGGVPLLALHGGPGTGISATQLRTIDPELFSIVTFDQRGCGRSTPFGCVDENTTEDLIADIEALRERLGIERWVVTGRSWGSTLALSYAIAHPDRVAALVPVAVYLARPQDTAWVYQSGASEFYPDDWEAYEQFVPAAERDDLLGAYARRMREGTEDERLAAARRLGAWEICTLWIARSPMFDSLNNDDDYVVSTGLLETHYLSQDCFLPMNHILDNAHVLRDIPGVIVHGRYDINCRVSQAWELHKAWPSAQLTIVEEAGHAQDIPANIDACVRAFRTVATLVAG